MAKRQTARERDPRWHGGAGRAVRIAVIVLLTLLAVVAVLLGAALATLQTDWARREVLTIALRHVNGAIRGQVEVDRLEGALPFRAVLIDARLRDVSGREVARLDRLEARITLPALLDRTVRLAGVTVEGFHVALGDREDRERLLDALGTRKPSLPAAAPPAPAAPTGEAPAPWGVEVRDIRLAGSADLAAGPEAAGLRDLHATASLRWADGTLTWDPIQAEARLVNLPVDHVRLDSAGSFGSEGWRVLRMDLQAGPHQAALHGTFVPGDDPVVDLVIDRAVLDLEAQNGARSGPAEPALAIRGNLDLVGRIAGPPSHLRMGFDVDTEAGAVTLAGTAGIEAGILSYDLTFDSRNLRPAGVVVAIPADLVLDVSGRLEGQGNPLAAGFAEAAVSMGRVEGTDPMPRSLDLGVSVRNGRTFATLQATGTGVQEIEATLSLDRPPPTAADLRVRASALDLEPLLGRAGTVRTLDARVRGHVAVDLALASVRVEIEATRLALGALRLARVHLDGDLGEGGGPISWRDVPPGRLAVGLEGLALAGHKLRRVDGNARWDANLEVTFQAVGSGDRLALDVSGDARLPVPGRGLSIDLRRLRLLDDGYGLRLGPGGFARLAASGLVTVRDLRLGGPGPGTRDLVVSGEYHLSTRALRADVTARELDLQEAHAYWLHLLDPSRIAPDSAPRGTLSLDGAVAGTLGKLAGSLAFRVADLDLRDLSGLRAEGTAALDRRGLFLDATAALADGGTLEVHAVAPVTISLVPAAVQFSRDRPARVDATLKDLDLAVVQSLLGGLAPRMGGKVDGVVRAEGTLDRPGGTLRLALREVTFDTLQNVSGQVEVSVAPDQTWAEISLVRRGGQSLRLAAEMSSDLVAALSQGSGGIGALRERLRRVPFRLSAAVHEFETSDLPFVSRAGGGWLRRAVLDGDLQASGTLADVAASGRLEARDLQLGMQPTDLSVSIQPDGHDAVVVVTLANPRNHAGFADATVRLPGGLGVLVGAPGGVQRLLRDDGLTVRLAAERLPVAVAWKLSPEFGRVLEALVPTGRLTAQVLAHGGADGLVAQAEAVLEPSGEAQTSRRGLVRSARLDLDMTPHRTQGSLTVDPFEGGGSLTLTGEFGAGTRALIAGASVGGAPVAAHLAAQAFVLDALGSAFPSIFGTTRGVLDADLRVEGTIRAPRVAGSAAATFAELTIAPAGLRLKDVVLGVEAGPDGLALTPLHIAQKKGTLDATLVLRRAAPLGGASRLDGRVAMVNFRLLDRRDARITLTGEAALGGTLARPEVTGRFEVDKARIRIDFGGRNVHGTGLPEGVVFVGPDSTPLAVPTPTPTLRWPILLDVALVAPPGKLHLKSSMIDARLAADLAVRTREDRVVVEGIVSVVKGTIHLYGRPFDLQKESNVVFDGSPGINPILHVKADYDIRHVDLSTIGRSASPESRVSIEVSGTAAQPTIAFHSVPSMDQKDIVAIIALGEPVGATPGQQDAVQSQTTKLVAGLATGTLTRALKFELPIDVLQVGQVTDAEVGTEIVAGKRITRDLLILYRANIGALGNDRNRNEVAVEYDITPYLEVRTSYGDAGQGALDLLFRWRY